MKVFRIAWVVLAVVVLGMDAAGIPYAYERYEIVCTRSAEVCAEDGLLTPEDARRLGELGISRGFYAAYQGVGVETAMTLICFAVAAVIFFRRSDDVMALFTSFVLLLFGGAGAAGTMRALAEAHSAFWFPVHLLDYVSQVCVGVFFYLFPTGEFVPRWTRWATVASAAFFVPDIFFPASAVATISDPLFFVFLGSLVIAQVYRYLRVSTVEQRQQTKWVVFGFAAALVGFMAVIALTFVPAIRDVGPLGLMVFSTLVYGFLALIPLSIGVAILRSRLYDIDVVINRALVYGPLTATLVALYFGGIVVLQRGFVALTGQQSTLAVVASTLAIATLFNPLRRRVQALVDRRFYRRKYDAAKTLAAFNSKLREETDLDSLRDDVLGVVRETMQPEHASLWLRSHTADVKENVPG
ncbi:MAG: hypothetical protein AVDCRST_MAG55-292 [uncultured Rubrobacteraceae bacterium]|uniref:Uncharacterized protein n=1 Tax=uncultured Rubrobacteraceae bacterium TaxID=349277 RepID=A0A6J4NQC7_9ACTN|nr:MAG: hypothetical protein AVDCRST_MAG55-292 [uncultured Rubrobacteraceae bacterium]